MTLKIGVVGASGLTGAEVVRLLAEHPQVEITAVTSETYAGKTLRQLYPSLQAWGQRPLTRLQDTALSPERVEVVFLALPHGESMALAPALLERGIKVIDLSGDFRFADTAVYEKWYGRPHTAKALAAEAVYGLPELFRKEIPGKRLVANPGCYVTAAVLALYPLLKNSWVDLRSLVVDAKSGVTGTGRKATFATSFNQVAENISAYKMAGTHQHTPEMENALGRATGQSVTLTFSPHLIPVRRGILATVYARPLKPRSTAELNRLYRETYAQEPFVYIGAEDEDWPDLAGVAGTNLCMIKAAYDERTQTVVAVAAIDNLIKGAAGQAIQNLNLMLGWEETLGLPRRGWRP